MLEHHLTMLPAALGMMSNEDADALGDAIVTIFLTLVAIATVAIVVAALGCFCAYRAAQGSRAALGGWIAVAVIEVVVQVLAVPPLVDGGFNVFLLFPGAALLAQAAVYVTTGLLERSSTRA